MNRMTVRTQSWKSVHGSRVPMAFIGLRPHTELHLTFNSDVDADADVGELPAKTA
jgi:hypothetical protein